MSDQGWVKFTGDYAKLKGMGYKFQKLYANNYMQWAKNGFRVWKRGHDITHDSVNLYQLIKFFRTNPRVRTWQGSGRLAFFKFYTDRNTRAFEYRAWTDENFELYRSNQDDWAALPEDAPKEDWPLLYSSESVSSEMIEQLEEFKALGWYELVPDPDIKE